MDSYEIIEKVDDLLEMDDEIQELLPYVRQCIKAYRWIRKKRMMRLLRTLDAQANEWSETKQKRFGRYVQSKEGQELLAEYSDTVLMTSSKIAHAALAFLYSDTENEEYSPRFKTLACSALRGCTDNLVDIFLLLISLPLHQRDENPYPMRFVHAVACHNN
jgi:hypothetical protein